MCDWGAEIETTSHFFLRCKLFSNERQKSYDDVYQIDASIRNLKEKSLYLMSYYMIQTGLMTVKIIHTIKSTKRFERPLIGQW